MAALGLMTSGESGAGINLIEHESIQVGNKTVGHTISEHVGKTAKQLSDRLAKNSSLQIASSFTNLKTANMAVNKIFSENASDISEWINNAKSGSFSQKFSADIGQKVGNFINRESGTMQGGSSASMRLVKNSNGGATVHTAFPHN